MSDHRVIQLLMTLREQGIHDQRVLESIEKTPRDFFVDQPFESAAYANTALPIACGQTISQPFVVAFVSQALQLEPKHRVLELGTGSGYQAAILAPLCRMVYTMERHKPLLTQAQLRFQHLKFSNVFTRLGDGLNGWPDAAPFDRIVLSASVPEVPKVLIDQLKPNGILIAPVGGSIESSNKSQSLTKIIKGEAGVTKEEMLPVMFVPMIGGLPRDAEKTDGVVKE